MVNVNKTHINQNGTRIMKSNKKYIINTNPDSKQAPIKDLDFTLDLPLVIHTTTLITQSWGMMVAASWVWTSASNCCQRASGLPFRDPTIGQSEIKPGKKPGTAWSLVFLPHGCTPDSCAWCKQGTAALLLPASVSTPPAST